MPDVNLYGPEADPKDVRLRAGISYGVSEMRIVMTSDTQQGVKSAFGTSSFPIVFNAATTGVRGKVGTTTFPIAFGYTTAGVRGKVGTVSFPIVVNYTSTGVRGKVGVVVFPIVFNYATAGIQSTPPGGAATGGNAAIEGLYWYYTKDGWFG